MPQPSSGKAPESRPAEKGEEFRSPSLLASWVNQYLLEALPLEGNYSLLPNEESRREFNITYEQRERYIREIPILRVAGLCLFVRQHYDDAFYVAFSAYLYPHLVKYLSSDSYAINIGQIAEAVEAYIDAASKGDNKKISLQYMRRVYDDSDHFVKLTVAGVGALAIDWFATGYEVFRDAYYKVTQGMSYESVRLITEAMHKAHGTPSRIP